MSLFAFLEHKLNEIINPTTGVTMSSREIAEFTGKSLSHVHRDIVSMIADLPVDDPEKDHVRYETDDRGYMACVHLPKELSITLVSGYSTPIRRAIVKRWQELEAKQIPAAPVVPTTLSGALRLAADQAEQIEQQQAALAIAAPKVDAFERIADSSGSITIREAAKDLGVPPGVLGDWLKANRWIYKQGKANLAFEPRINSGLMEHKVTVLELEDEDGTPRTKSVSQPRITPKGLAKLALEVPGARS